MVRGWLPFFREHRLRFQLDLAHRNGHGKRLQETGHRLLERMDDLLSDHRPAPSLLHGDLCYLAQAQGLIDRLLARLE